MADENIDKSKTFVRIQRTSGGPIDTCTLEAWEALYSKDKEIQLVNDAGERTTPAAAVKEATASVEGSDA